LRNSEESFGGAAAAAAEEEVEVVVESRRAAESAMGLVRALRSFGVWKGNCHLLTTATGNGYWRQVTGRGVFWGNRIRRRK